MSKNGQFVPARKRIRLGLHDEEGELRLPGPGPDATERELIEWKRQQNTLAARRNRRLRLLRRRELKNQENSPFRGRLLAGAELHSTERLPPPRCHPRTREHLRKEVNGWLTNEDRKHNMLWLFGPAGVGKSAIAQTTGELAEELRIFSAAIFFSKSRKVYNPSLFITSLAYQLSLQYNSYRKLVTDVVEGDPTILTGLDRRRQFKKLIIEPFSTLKCQGEEFTRSLVVIDGLDECRGETEQVDLIRLIAEAIKDPDPPPFLFMICSRPEHHLKEFFQDDGLSNICLRLDLLPYEPDADTDIERYLVDGLKRIMERCDYQRHPNTALSEIGDSDVIKKLIRAASGIFVIASSILAFIGGGWMTNPASRLQIVLNVIDGSPTDSDVDNFLAPIDRLYVGVLGEVENDQRSTALRLLGTCAISPPIPALQLANLLDITQEKFYSALRPLHAFISVPHHTLANEEHLHFFHASFPDFLSHRARSKEYYQDPESLRSALAEACFRALNSSDVVYSQGLSWPPPDFTQDEDEDDMSPSALSVSYDILSFAATHIWEICTEIPNPQPQLLLKMLAFDFRRLQPFDEIIPVQPFIHYVRSLYALGGEVLEFADIVRTDPLFDMDERLLTKCGSVSRPLNLNANAQIDEHEKSPRHVLAGFDMKTVLILFVSEAAMIYSMADVDIL